MAFPEPKDLQINDVMAPSLKRHPPRHRPGEKFLKGPIPWNWLQVAGARPGRVLHVAILLWQKAGCEKSNIISFNQAVGQQMGLSVPTTRRGLRELEEAGLVKVERLPGRALKVTIKDFVLQQKPVD